MTANPALWTGLTRARPVARAVTGLAALFALVVLARLLARGPVILALRYGDRVGQPLETFLA